LESIGQKLNLKEHLVGAKESLVKTSFPADIEAHIGKVQIQATLLTYSRIIGYTCSILLDFFHLNRPGTYWTVGFSQQWSIKGSRFFRLLREELVRLNPVPLCSDAFAGKLLLRPHLFPAAFQRFDPAKTDHNAHVVTAFTYLKEHRIPEFANWLEDQSTDERNVSER
jgi:hypothetical protein